jgi:hypothetical protein
MARQLSLILLAGTGLFKTDRWGGHDKTIRVSPISEISKTIAQPGDPIVLGAMVAAIEGAALFESVPDDARPAMLAGWRKGMNGTFEAIESMRRAVHHDLKCLVVCVSAGLASGHISPPG